MGRFLRRRSGFSLIELLIVVAIIAALVGVAVPFFQDNLSEAQRTKAKQDLEIIKKSIALYDAREPRPLTGTDLKPLLGRYMQEQPKDPWGNDYLFDGAVGFVCSYGADALPLGSGGDTDITVYTKPPVLINRVQYQGPWGKVKAMRNNEFSSPNGNKFLITLSKPAFEATPGSLTSHLVLLTDLNSTAAPCNAEPSLQCKGGQVLGTSALWTAGTWESSATSGAIDPLHQPGNGVMVVAAYNDNPGSAQQSVTPTMALDFLEAPSGTAMPGGKSSIAGDALAGQSAGGSVVETTYQNRTPNSPMDINVYGADAYNTYSRNARCSELVNNERRGVRLEKY